MTSTVAGYQLDQVLGRGGMGVVYAAARPGEPPVAIKLFHEEIAVLGEAIALRLGAVLQLSHPHLIRLLEAGPGYLVMALVHGESLHERLARAGALDDADAIEVMLGILPALGALHGAGILHRDVKPENVLLTEEGVILIDTADSIVADVLREAMHTRKAFGTPQYMAPEVMHEGTGIDIDARADIYAAGLLFFELLAGCPAFDDADPTRVLEMQVAEPLPFIEDLSPELDEILKRMTAKDPADRYRTANEVRRVLQALAKG